MKKIMLIFVMIAALLSLLLCAGCGDDDGDGKTKGTDSQTDSDTTPTTNPEVNKTVLNLNFDDGAGAGDKFYVSLPASDDDHYATIGCTVEVEEEVDSASDSDSDSATDTTVDTDSATATDSATVVDTATATDSATDSDSTTDSDTTPGAPEACVLKHYIDNNTAVEVGGQTALTIHADSYDRWEDGGPRVEVQFKLDEQMVNMSYEDYRVEFDIYLPQAMVDKKCEPQFALYELANYTPIYSTIFGGMVADTWTHVTGTVKRDSMGGNINYSKFSASPDDWKLDALRIQLVCDEALTMNGDEVLYYLDNILVTNAVAQ